MELKPKNVTKGFYTEYLRDKVISKIKSRFPFRRNKAVLVQQDNERPHISPTALQTLQYNQSGLGKRIELVCQSRNSPRLNVLDFQFFNLRKSWQAKNRALSITELFENVTDAFQSYKPETLTDVSIKYQSNLEIPMAFHRSNDYKI